MKFTHTYPFLKQNKFSKGEYSIIPIRYEDRMVIMQWRNEQIYHLRQEKPLTESDQENYFTNVVAKLFEQEYPNQILFSYLKNNQCIGYGGLVHINWVDKNAEISFIMDTRLERDEFHKHWKTYLDLLEQVAFNELDLHKIYTYAFDLRPHLYEAVEASGYYKEAILKEHCLFEGQYKDVVIHSKLNRKISLRTVEANDVKLLYDWANDKQTRENSFNSEEIVYEQHQKWFNQKLEDTNAVYFICEVNKMPAGLARFDIQNKDEAVIGISIAPNFRGKKLSVPFLKQACEIFRKDNHHKILAYIKKTNIASVKSFEKAGFIFEKKIDINQIPSYLFIYGK